MSDSPYLRGDGAASAYLGMVDPQGRAFRRWADQVGLPFTLLGRIRTYRKRDIDKAWERAASNILTFQMEEAQATG